MSVGSFNSGFPEPLSQYPLGPSGLPLIDCPDCGDRVIECKAWTKGGEPFFKCVRNETHVPDKCGFFKWMTAYRKVLGGLVQKYEMKKKGNVHNISGSKGQVGMNVNSIVALEGNVNKIGVEGKMDMAAIHCKMDNAAIEVKMDNLIHLVHLLVVCALVIIVLLFLGVLVLIFK